MRSERSPINPFELTGLVDASLASANARGADRGFIVYLEKLRSAVGAEAERPVEPTAESPLTLREKNILELVARGRTNKDIARSLGIAPETVKSHVKSIFAKLGVSSRAEAVMKMIRA